MTTFLPVFRNKSGSSSSGDSVFEILDVLPSCPVCGQEDADMEVHTCRNSKVEANAPVMATFISIHVNGHLIKTETYRIKTFNRTLDNKIDTS